MSKKKNWRQRDPESSREAARYEHPIPSRTLILKDLKRHGVPLTLERLAADFDLTDERDAQALAFRLRAMVRDGQIIRNRQREYCLIDEIPVLAGRVIAHRDGFGFVALDQGGDDVFLSPREMRQAFHGDRAAVRITGRDRRGRPEGRIVDILDRATQELAGRYVKEAGVGFVVAENPRITHQIVIPPGEHGGAKPGRVVSVEIVEPPTKSSPPIGRVIEVLGDITKPGMETEVAIRSHGLRHRFGKDVTREADAFGDAIPRNAIKGRIDLRDTPLVTIDGADARDFDDAVFCEKVGRNYRLLVAIADVSHYVTPGNALDDEAQERGTSVYFPNRVIPMFPEALSNGLCSLNPDVDRLCMVCEMTVTPAGNVKDETFFRGVMRSQARLTYAQAYAILWEGDKVLHRRYAHVVPHLEQLKGVYEALARARVKRGAVDLDIPSSRFEFAPDGHPEGVVRYTRNDAHRLIEECMIAANVSAARFLKANKMPALYRNHAEPDEEKVETLRSFLKTVGITLPRAATIKPSHYQKVGKALAERPDASVLYFQLLRSMSQAEYTPDCDGHFGLALKEYAHFTSPIRRYPDLLVHRAINHVLLKKSARRYVYKSADMERLGRECSIAERRAEEAVRDVESWLKCEVMLDHVGDAFDGTVVGVAEFGLFVEITDMNIEGLVHVTALGHDYFKLDPTRSRLSGRQSGQSFELAQALRVRVAGVSIQDRKIDFTLEEKAGRKKSRGTTSKKTASKRRGKNSKSSGARKSRRKR
ncbi:MAG: ribonuclease R [Gammaproteobacteria bacterium]